MTPERVESLYLFDHRYTLDDARSAVIGREVVGEDGLTAAMAATIGDQHQIPTVSC